MKKFIGIILVMGLVSFLASPVILAQDSTEVEMDLGKGWKLKWLNISFGAMIQSTEDSEAQLEAKPFIGGGPSALLLNRRNWGLSLSGLFYMNEAKTLYPILAGGIVLFPDNKVAVSLGWDFGKIAGTQKDSWKERLRVLINYNL